MIDIVPLAPGSGRTIICASPWVCEISALLSAVIKDTLYLSSPSKIVSGFVRRIKAFAVSPYKCI